MSDDKEYKLRCLKNGDWYWISRTILNQYGQVLKVSGIAVYNVLASYANSNTQACYPTQQSVAEIVGISRRTVNRKIRILRELGLIKIKKSKGRCIYTLLKTVVPKQTQRCDIRDTRDVTPGNTNKNELIKINNKNNDKENFNSLKPISHFIKGYGQKNSKNNRH